MTPQQVVLTPTALLLDWGDGAVRLTHAALRGACRCSQCESARRQGHPLALSQDVRIVRLEALGHYAVQLVFSDGHDRGIYPWEMLARLSALALQVSAST
ncbi:DUF971 domain-containing protein [Silvimonas amylolytica]|uniref:Gamma-butyrobetaine hydroxylase-like N-terminal domain-containing protein n=1 Tax=Silvimonas amylolytica TaxID=449663 RepID=A0ABQ2PPR3_9NEIS|nr:DUF971 domain-containing protein [Silvimonas amylolytica]GGP27605.1 hypothetical protein GCM10010971_34240 [Silvimonas amylolytica]